MGIDEQVATIRESGCEGPLTMAIHHEDSGCFILHLLAFKNSRFREEQQRHNGGFRYVLPPPVSRLFRFFAIALRPLLQPCPTNRMLFVQTTGRGKGGPFNAQRDAFGHLCGTERGLHIGTSIRSIRHIVSTEAVRSPLTHSSLLNLPLSGATSRQEGEQISMRPTFTRLQLPCAIMLTLRFNNSKNMWVRIHVVILFEALANVRNRLAIIVA